MKLMQWVPALILGTGCLLVSGVRPQLSVPLAQPLPAVVPNGFGDNTVATDHELSAGELEVVGLSNYVMRTYTPVGEKKFKYTVYVGYYERQTRGRTIHSPKNCLPGGGWEALSSQVAVVNTPGAEVKVNRYLLHRKGQQALVLYWYQGRGRVESNEYKVKWNLLRDAALHRRSEEALVRVMVPVVGSEEQAFRVAAAVAAKLVPAVQQALPS